MDKLIKATGGHVDALVLSLVDAAFDKKCDVRNDLKVALCNLGRKQPELVLSTCNCYLQKHQQLAQGHRVLLLDIMMKIIKDAAESVSLDLTKELVIFASNELTKSKDIIQDWQKAASNVLVALGVNASQEVMIEMLKKINPGALPHYYVILTLANLAKENVFGVVPFMKDIFSRMLSMLGMVKTDTMRLVFAGCIGSFSEAILDYCANIDSAPYPDISKDRFNDEIFTVFEVMFNVWATTTKDAKVQIAIIEAFGYMSHLISKEKLEEYIQRLLQGITSMYRRHTEHHVITQSLCMVLEAACSDGSLMLLPVLDQMLNGLHIQACNKPDFTNPVTVKNHNEILRCFQVLAQNFSDRVVGYLQQKLEQVSEKSKCATLAILKHLINSSDVYLAKKKDVIISSVTILLTDSSLKVCQSFAQCIIAMAHHDYLSLEGGDKLVEFIIRMCNFPEDDKSGKRTVENDSVTVHSLRVMCQNILHLMATTVDVVESVLWPYLLEFILPVQYTEAIGALCRSLAVIAHKKKTNDDKAFMINYKESVNTPKPQAILARLLVITGHPLKNNSRGLPALNFLKAYSPNINENIVDMWDTVIPKLVLYLQENSHDKDGWNQKAWEDLILKLLAKTLSEVDSEEWFLVLGREMGLQLALYTGLPDEKNFLYKCLGVVLRKIGTTDFISEHLNLIFTTVDHTNQAEREGCAVGVGFCAASHLDQCLMKLEEVTKTKMVRRATGFMGLMKDKTEAEVERIKSTVMLCYGYVVFYGPPSLICSRLEANVWRVVSPYFNNIKDSSVKHNLIRTVELIGKAVQPNHIQSDEFIFQKRGDLLRHMQNFLKSESKSNITEIRASAIDAMMNLIKLRPSLAETDLKDVISTCCEHVYPITIVSSPQSGSQNQVLPNKKEYSEENQENVVGQTLASLNSLMKEVIIYNATPHQMQLTFDLLQQYITSIHNHQRERVMETVKVVFTNYQEAADFSSGEHFSGFGEILGKLLPRSTDPVTAVRQNAVECIQMLLVINDRYEGVPSSINDERIQALSQLRETLSKNDPAVLFNVVNELSLVISKKTPDNQLKSLIFTLIASLKDYHSQSSSGACAILNCLMKYRGGELGKEVYQIVHDIVANLRSVAFNQTVTGSLVAMRTLATHHLINVLQAFLDFPVPLEETTTEFWKTLAKDKDLLGDTFEHLLDLLQRTPPYAEPETSQEKKNPVLVAASLPLAITAAFTEIFKVSESDNLISQFFSKIISAILLRLGSSLNVAVVPSDKKASRKSLITPHQLSIRCFKEFLKKSKRTSFKKLVEDSSCFVDFEHSSTFTSGVEKVVIALCDSQVPGINEIVTSLLPSLSSLYSAQRMVTAAVFAELINQHCCGDMHLLELLMNSLLSKLVDHSQQVRMLCIRGLGNMVSIGAQKIQAYSTTILSAMMAGMDDKEDTEMKITLEAMNGLSKILSLLDETSIRQILINICLRIRPCFEKENALVRAASIHLFGKLSRFGQGPSKTAFLEQVHTNFISILLHLSEEQEVTKASKETLRQIGPCLDSKSINNMFQKHLIADGNLHYGEFMNDLSRLIIQDYLEKMNFYVMGCITFFKSKSEDIRANAALFVGFLLGNLKKEDRHTVSTDHCCGALLVLLKDPSPMVRSRAAEAISLLYDY